MLKLFNKLSIIAMLATAPCLPALAAGKAWTALTPIQQEALAPIASQWGMLPETQQKRLLATSKRYPHLTPQQKQLFLSRLTAWSKLTPEQRMRAREKYKEFRKLPPEKREELKHLARQKELNRQTPAAASGVTPAGEK